MIVLVQKETNRLRYTLQLLLNRLLGIQFELCTNLTDFLNYTGPKFSYGVPVDDKTLYFAAENLLFERNIKNRPVGHILNDGIQALFPVNDKNSAFNFDIFAASFYLVSRYEEYLPVEKDIHNRFSAFQSDAYKYKYLQLPVVNIWSIKLKEVFEKWFPKLNYTTPQFDFIPTIDIDSAYAYKNKGITRLVGGLLRSLHNRNIAELKQRLRVFFRQETDPFDTFELQFKLQKKYNYRAMYFFLLADYGLNDKNIPHNNRQFQQLIRKIADYADVGIHPSYASFTQPKLLQTEIDRLQSIIKYEISSSRQHFLRIHFPATYENLINCEITNDYTMGYADVAGFRASICTPYPFFDLSQDMLTNLTIHPFVVMDGTLSDYMKLSAHQASEVISRLMEEVYKVGGTFIPVWHNPAFALTETNNNWLEVYEKMAQKANALKMKNKQ